MADGMAGGGSANVVPHTLHTRSWPVPAFIDVINLGDPDD